MGLKDQPADPANRDWKQESDWLKEKKDSQKEKRKDNEFMGCKTRKEIEDMYIAQGIDSKVAKAMAKRDARKAQIWI